LLRSKDTMAHIEIKPTPGFDRATGAPFHSRCVWLIDAFTEADWKRLEALAATSLHTNHKKFDVAWVKPLHDAGYRIMLYTVNDIDRAKALLDAGVDGVFTDELEAFAKAFPELR